MEFNLKDILEFIKALKTQEQAEIVKAFELAKKQDPFQSENVQELITALGKAQGEFPIKIKELNVNNYNKTSYADIDDILVEIRPILSKNGLSITQQIKYDGTKSVLATRLWHNSGQWIESRMEVTPIKNDIQGFGAAITYSRRYSLLPLLALSTGNDLDIDSEKNMTFKKESTDKYKKLEEPKKDSKETINIKLIKEIEHAAEQLKNLGETDYLNKILEYYKVKDFKDIPSNQLPEVHTRINKKFSEFVYGDK